MCPLDAKVSAFCNFPAPADRKELRRFLGMVGYYRGFCENFSSVVAPLTDLLSPNVTYQVSEQCRKPFENIKALLISAPVLAALEFSKPFFLAVDASDQGAGTVLMQDGAPYATSLRSLTTTSGGIPPSKRRRLPLYLQSNILRFIWGL